MKRLSLFLLFVFLSTEGWSLNRSDFPGPPALLLYAPSVSGLMSLSREMISHFYGRNDKEIIEDWGLKAKEDFGINPFSLKSLSAVGIKVSGPVAFVHFGESKGYLMLTLQSSKLFKKYLQKHFTGHFIIKKNRVYLSADPSLPALFQTGVKNFPGLDLAIQKLGFQWKRPFVYAGSRYIAEVSEVEGYKKAMAVPAGFTAFVFNKSAEKWTILAYSAELSSKQKSLIRSISKSGSNEKFDTLDYGWGEPAIISHIRLNFQALWQYYQSIDRADVIGLKKLVIQLKSQGINIEKDLLANLNGEAKLVVFAFDQKKQIYQLYGCLGIKSRALAQSFIESLKKRALSQNDKIFSFEIFTQPIYHYQGKHISWYFGVIEDQLFFSTDKDMLVKVVKNIYENHEGYLDQQPAFLRQASKNNKRGFFTHIDMQSLFASVKPGGKALSYDILAGMSGVYLTVLPDTGADGYGWFTKLELRFYPGQNKDRNQ